MATNRAYPGPIHRPTEAPTPTTTERAGALESWRQRRAERKRSRLVSARSRRVHAQWLRRTANRASDQDPLRRRREALLHYRAAAVRGDLLELAAMLDRTHEPDATCMAALHDLLANGCDSPLYNKDIPVSELHTTIERVHAGLAAQRHA
jgi:hypothetical protein